MAKRITSPENPLSRKLISDAAARSPRPAVAAEPERAAAASTPASQKSSYRSRQAAPPTTRSQVTMKTRFGRTEAEANAIFAETLASVMQSKVAESHITRALWSIARRAEEELTELKPHAPQMTRPSHGDRMGMAAYEDAIAEFLLQAIKKVPKGRS